jgi:hypothetical protein
MQVSKAPSAANDKIGAFSHSLAATGIAAASPARTPSMSEMARRSSPVGSRRGSAPGLRVLPRWATGY